MNSKGWTQVLLIVVSLSGCAGHTAFGTVPSEVLFGVFESKDRSHRPSLLYAGDDVGSKEIAATVIHDVGFEPLDAGPLRMARYMEPFTLLIAQLAYEGSRGPGMAYRFEWLEDETAKGA